MTSDAQLSVSSATAEMHKYFDEITSAVTTAHALALCARKKGIDAERSVEVSLAKNMAERVVGLISVVAPGIVNSGVVERIIELEKEFGALDWRVALKISVEIAMERFCKFASKKEAMEIGIRTGFAYSTVGVVSSPLDGLIGIEFKQRVDGKGEYVCVNYAGPIRNAGGTNAAVSVLIADYVRKEMGYTTYDATNEEIKRASTELQDYHERVTNLQYQPSDEELAILMRNLPVEVNGDPSEQINVSNYKDLPRIKTNQIRSGYCLVLSSCLCLKAPKLWKQLSKWGSSFGLEHWKFLEEFLVAQKKAKAQGATKQSAGITPDFTFIHDLVAGRPVFSHPLQSGGFRLRYGRSRLSGFSCCGVHPATMVVSKDYIACGTQIKLERPSKGCVVSPCDTIEGPVVRLNDGSVLQLKTAQQAKEYVGMVKEILYLGDLLVSFGDFFNRAHPLVPAGYCPEWWAREFEKAIVTTFGALDVEKAADLTGVSADVIRTVLRDPLRTQITADTAINLTKLSVPLHPQHTYYWTSLTVEQFGELVRLLCCGAIQREPGGKIVQLVLPCDPAKRSLELIGLPHIVRDGVIVIDEQHTTALLASLGHPNRSLSSIRDSLPSMGADLLAIVNSLAGFVIRDKGGTFIGGRMGRPEKAKMRSMTGTPHALFPVGEEGGKYRSFQNCLAKGKITAEIPTYWCETCKHKTVFSMCPFCSSQTTQLWYCKLCNWKKEKECEHGPCRPFNKETFALNESFRAIVKMLDLKSYPDLIKGVRGTSNKDHVPEHLGKGILRAKHEVFVNKDGTTRYDMTQMPLTHFTPKEIRTSVSRLAQLGYTTDITGAPLETDTQVLELKPQDIVLPSCSESPDERADDVLLRLTQFIDEELASLYKEKSFYNATKPQDLVGHLMICLAPHTSAGIVGRIIGFSDTLGFLAHPYLHAATRRDCDGDEACIILLMDAFLNFSRKYLPESRGSTMDAPLVLTTVIIPSEVDDMAFDLDVAWHYPLELYEKALAFKSASEVKIDQLKARLGTPNQYEKMGFTHSVVDVNDSVHCSAYKTLPTMEDKLNGQMELAEKIRAVDTSDVARLVIEKHFIKDARGNLRKFATQEFRCVDCNEKYRRPPLVGKCVECNGKLIFTVSEGNVVKYLAATTALANKYNLSPYLKQSIQLLHRMVESVFGKEKERQTGLNTWGSG